MGLQWKRGSRWCTWAQLFYWLVEWLLEFQLTAEQILLYRPIRFDKMKNYTIFGFSTDLCIITCEIT